MGGTPGIFKGWTQTLGVRAGRGGHLALPGIGNTGASRSRRWTSITPSSPESKTSVTGERDSRRVLVLERRRVSDGPTDVETGSEGGRRIYCLPGRDFGLFPCTTFRRDPWTHSSRTAKAHIDEHTPQLEYEARNAFSCWKNMRGWGTEKGHRNRGAWRSCLWTCSNVCGWGRPEWTHCIREGIYHMRRGNIFSKRRDSWKEI